MQHHLVDEAAQQGFFVLLLDKLLLPQRGKMLADGFEGRLQLRA